MKRSLILLLVIASTSSFFKVFSQEKGYSGSHVELGYAVEITNKGNTLTGPQLFITPSYSLNNNTTIGVGAGVKLFRDADDKVVSAFPLYANAMHRFNNTKISPFIEGKLGYTLMNKTYDAKLTNYYPEYPGTVDVHSKRKGGLFFSPSFGAFFPIKSKQRFSVAIAYILDQQYIEAYAVQINKTEKETRTYHSIALRLGYIF